VPWFRSIDSKDGLLCRKNAQIGGLDSASNTALAWKPAFPWTASLLLHKELEPLGTTACFRTASLICRSEPQVIRALSRSGYRSTNADGGRASHPVRGFLNALQATVITLALSVAVVATGEKSPDAAPISPDLHPGAHRELTASGVPPGGQATC